MANSEETAKDKLARVLTLNSDSVFDSESCAVRSFANRINRLEDSSMRREETIFEFVLNLQLKGEENLKEIKNLKLCDEIDWVSQELLVKISAKISAQLESLNLLLDELLLD